MSINSFNLIFETKGLTLCFLFCQFPPNELTHRKPGQGDFPVQDGLLDLGFCADYTECVSLPKQQEQQGVTQTQRRLFRLSGLVLRAQCSPSEGPSGRSDSGVLLDDVCVCL